MKINNGDSISPTKISEERIMYLMNSLALAKDSVRDRYSKSAIFSCAKIDRVFMIPFGYFYFAFWRLKMCKEFPKDNIYQSGSHFVTFQSYLF